MHALKLKQAATLAAVTVVLCLSGYTDAFAKEFDNPRIDGLVLDGCYRFPGRCDSRRQANAFCRRRGFDEAVDWEAVNRGGLITTKRLGDGGTCVANCTVMTSVECE
jgi:hypothetical protein